MDHETATDSMTKDRQGEVHLLDGVQAVADSYEYLRLRVDTASIALALLEMTLHVFASPKGRRREKAAVFRAGADG